MSIRVEDKVQCLECKKWSDFKENMPFVDQDFCSNVCESKFLSRVD